MCTVRQRNPNSLNARKLKHCMLLFLRNPQHMHMNWSLDTQFLLKSTDYVGFVLPFLPPGQPTFDIKPESVEVTNISYKGHSKIKGCSATFRCSCSGDPEPFVQWLRDGKEIEHETNGTSPTIVGVFSTSYRTTISCRATNVWNSVERSAELLCLPFGQKANGTMDGTGKIACCKTDHFFKFGGFLLPCLALLK